MIFASLIENAHQNFTVFKQESELVILLNLGKESNQINFGIGDAKLTP